MKLFKIISFFLPIITNSLNINVPIKSDSLQDFYKCVNNINFFKLNMNYLECENVIINQNIEKQNVNWPVILSYDRKHIIKKFPSLPIPKMRTTEIWNINIQRYEITGTIKTKLITITLKIKINEQKNNNLIIKKNRSLLLTTNVENKSLIIPISKYDIESDVSKQIIDNMKLVLKEMNNRGICQIEIIDNIY